MSVRPISATAGSSGRTALGGIAGNELLTGATAAVLTLLLAAEGVTILFLGGLLTEHKIGRASCRERVYVLV